MKLSECKIGTVVIMKHATGEELYGDIGHVTGLTYNVSLKHTGSMSSSELRERTIPIVKFPDGERPIHHCNLEIYSDTKNYNWKTL